MQVTELQNEGLKREFKIVLPIGGINDKVGLRLVDLSKKVKLKGFRPGKVPLDKIKKMYYPQVFTEVVNQEISNTVADVIKVRELRPVSTPKLTIVTCDEASDVEYKMFLEVHPHVPEIAFNAIQLKQLTIAVEEKDIEQGLQKLAEYNKDWVAPEPARLSQLGDTVVMDFDGYVDGKPFQGGKAEGFRLELGSGRFIAGYEEQLVGVKAGQEKDVNVTFPENYFNKDLAAKDARFAVKVHEILEPKIAVINDEFAKKMGVDDLAALRNAIKEQLVKEFTAIARTKMKKDLFDQLDAQLILDIPESMVDMEEEELLRQGAAGDNGKDFTDEEKKELHEISIRRVKLGIVMAEIAMKNNIGVTNDELRLAVQKQARRFPGQEYKIIEHYQKNNDALKQLQGPILEEKVIDFLFKETVKGEEPISIDALVAFNESDGE